MIRSRLCSRKTNSHTGKRLRNCMPDKKSPAPLGCRASHQVQNYYSSGTVELFKAL